MYLFSVNLYDFLLKAFREIKIPFSMTMFFFLDEIKTDKANVFHFNDKANYRFFY